MNIKIEIIIGISAIIIFAIVIGMFIGKSMSDYNFSKTITMINNKKHTAEQGKIIRWGFFPDSSIIEMRFSNNTEINCIKKDNVIRIMPMENSVFCELRLFNK